MLLIVAEVSMVGANTLIKCKHVDKRLQQIKGVSDDAVFGGVSIVAVGDLYHLPPVGQAPLFSSVSDCYACPAIWLVHCGLTISSCMNLLK